MTELESRGAGGRGRSWDPVELQIVAAAMRTICEEMGAVLTHAAYSPNIKERRDASTALFDSRGEMVMQAEHIPVHLGSMPDAVAEFVGLEADPGDVFAVSDPFRGGTHLPDITVVSPVFDETEEMLGFVANRAHHADVGGMMPASMPANSTEILQEGVVIPPVRLVRAGRLQRDLVELMLANMRHPSQRRADLRAQLAANRVGSARTAELAERMGRSRLMEAMDAVLDYAERQTRASIARWPKGAFSARDVLEDDGTGRERDIPIVATVTIGGDSVDVDFTGTAPATDSNLNCPLSVTKSATYYVVRVLSDPGIPSSAGACRPIRVAAAPGSLLAARYPSAVAGGNVETSSRIVDVLFSAFGKAMPVPAMGQGTMNNITLGTPEFTYYETLGGGQGACPDADGPSGIHVAMSNTLNTPIEAIELEYPLRIRRYSLRRGSGGAGHRGGGDGLVREIEALESMTYSLLTERRRHAPEGAAGGQGGSPGVNLVNGRPVAGKATGRVARGDRITIETPGGGGHGAPRE